MIGVDELPELILRRLLRYCFGELGCLYRCDMNVSKPAIEIRKALMFLENIASHRRPVLFVVLSRTYALNTLNS